MVESVGCSSRRPRSGAQHPQGGSQSSVAPVPASSSGLCWSGEGCSKATDRRQWLSSHLLPANVFVKRFYCSLNHGRAEGWSWLPFLWLWEYNTLHQASELQKTVPWGCQLSTEHILPSPVLLHSSLPGWVLPGGTHALSGFVEGLPCSGLVLS